MVLYNFAVSNKDGQLLRDTYNKLKRECDQLPPEVVKKLLTFIKEGGNTPSSDIPVCRNGQVEDESRQLLLLTFFSSEKLFKLLG